MQNQSVYELCELCGMKCPKELILNNNELGLTQCYDCLFSMNFNDEKILNGQYNYNLDKYIEVSSKYHAELYDLPCFRLTDNGGCYICMKLLDIPIDRKIISNQNNSDNKIIEIKQNENKNIEENINILDNDFKINEEIVLNL